MTLFDRAPQGRAGAEQVRLADELLEATRAHLNGQRAPGWALSIAPRLMRRSAVVRVLVEEPLHTRSIARVARAAALLGRALEWLSACAFTGGCRRVGVEPMRMSIGAAELLPSPGGGLDFLDLGGELAARSPLQLFWRRFRRDRVALGALAFIVFLVVLALAAPLVVKALGLTGPNVENPGLTNAFGSPLGPSAAHPFGVDQLGQDVMSRVIYGTRVSLEVGILGTAIATAIGVLVGVLAGYYRGWVDTLLSRLTDVMLSVPLLMVGLGLGAACAVRGCVKGVVQPGVGSIVFIIALANWTYMARIVRGLVLSLREREFVEASRALGASDTRIMFKEILPNLLAPVIVYATLLIPANILFEAALSFLGVGIRPPSASWGQMIAQATPIFNTAWWYMTFPGVALLLTVLAFNLVGDGLQDALNPRSAR
jgi:peptide/nickel transport system permease protein